MIEERRNEELIVLNKDLYARLDTLYLEVNRLRLEVEELKKIIQGKSGYEIVFRRVSKDEAKKMIIEYIRKNLIVILVI